ncbi:hypothetical protein [Pseudonocardia zijingensis]|uniref:Uncharacterized protein n=1 Tax=Pseudonocardia zijingensis TaxID=153376 RepID=A0ABP3YN32_9PSEU
MTTVSQDASQLGRAIELVVADYREEGYPEATVEEALSSTLAELDLDDIANLSSGADPVLSPEVAKAYREVLTADRADITRETGIALTGAAAARGGETDSPGGEPPYTWLGAPACPPSSGTAAVRNHLTPTRGHSAGYDGAYARRYGRELPAAAVSNGRAVVEVEHPDAATAVAAAAAAVAQANGLAQDEPVIVVVSEDVPDWVAEDPGF